VPAGPGGDPIRLALDAIDRVHRDGALPRIVVRRGLLRPSRQGYYDPVASQVVVNDATTRPALTMLHETGHIIDLYGLGTSDAFASVVEAELNDWRRAAGGTQALQRLTELGQTIVEPDKARYLRYLTMVEEIWARSYAQYIVTRSAEPELQRQLDMV